MCAWTSIPTAWSTSGACWSTTPTDSRVTILESRLWQNSALFMYMTTYRAEDVMTFNRQVFQTLRPLAPVLLYLVQDETEAALRRLYTFHGDE